MSKWIICALHSLNGALLCSPAGYTSLPLLLLYVLYVCNFVMIKRKALEPFHSAGGGHHSLQTVSWLIMTEQKVQVVTA